MKRTIQFALLMLFASAFSITPVKSQDSKQATELAKKYEAAYNKKDVKALQSLHTKDGTRTNADGTVQTGAEAIAKGYAEDFKNTDFTVAITTEKSETGADGTIVATGTYTIKGKVKDTGEMVDFKGAFSNTMVKDSGNWKVSKMVLSDIKE